MDGPGTYSQPPQAGGSKDESGTAAKDTISIGSGDRVSGADRMGMEVHQANPNDKRIPPVTLNSIIKKLNYISDDVRAYWIAYHQYEKYQDE